MYLPPDGDHPPRLDVPILRHLTFTELHAAELGTYLGFLIVWSMVIGQQFVVLLLVVAAGRKIISRQNRQDPRRSCDHDVGFHDVIAEPAYFGALAVAIPLVYVLAF